MSARQRRVLVVLVCVLSLALGALTARRDLIYNATASYPLGFYRLRAKDSFERGDLVIFAVPPGVRDLVRDRSYIPPRGDLMKTIIGVAGDRYCLRDDYFYVRGLPVGPVFKTDARSQPLPRLTTGCREVPSGSVLVASRSIERSFDSRYFGPIPTHTILGVTEPLWTW